MVEILQGPVMKWEPGVELHQHVLVCELENKLLIEFIKFAFMSNNNIFSYRVLDTNS